MQLIKFAGLGDKNERLAKLMSYKVTYNKLWSSDSGRSLTGAYKGTLIGIFPKLSIKIAPQNNQDRQLLLTEFNKDFDNVTYYDTYQGKTVTKKFYFGDAADTVKKAVGKSENGIKHDSIEIEIVATTKL